ncbi:MAG: Gfo/Idh/MocA family oxidoreductase [Alphaproteobacteria bacterium]|nr:Gfo/Idh/MocA family oxidoreductase [Alphaproteobacteria bacterium]
MTRFRAAVIGLGQVGSRFDEEPRPAVWSHVGAYLARQDRFELAGGADPSEVNRDRFATRCPGLPTFDDAAALMRSLRPDVVSLCTPHFGRARLVETILAAHRPRLLICEKPLEVDAAQRQHLLDVCREAGVTTLVHYNRRFMPTFRLALRAMAEGRLGKLTSITVTSPNRLWSVGSHAYDALLYLAGEAPIQWQALPLPALSEGNEPAADFLCRFPSGLAGRIVTGGYKASLIFEFDILGTDGRLTILDNGKRLVFRPLLDSPQYLGYRCLGPEQVWHESPADESSFLAIIDEAADLLSGKIGVSASPAEAAAGSETLLDAVINLARQDIGSS